LKAGNENKTENN